MEDISIARKESHYLSIEISFACKRGKNSVKSYLSYGDAMLLILADYWPSSTETLAPKLNDGNRSFENPGKR